MRISRENLHVVMDIKDQSIFPQDAKHLLILTNFSLDYALMYLLGEN